MDKITDDKKFINELKEILPLWKKAMTIYVIRGQEKIIENEEYESHREQYPFDEYYYFKEEFRHKWE